jgi:hypothetical protein
MDDNEPGPQALSDPARIRSLCIGGLMEFFAPGRLWLLLLVPAMLAVYLGAQRRRGQYARRFSEVPLLDQAVSREPRWRRHAAVGLALLAVGSCVVAFAQPKGKVKVPRERATIVVVIDVSLSMMATDVDPSRLEAAKKAAKSFVARLPAGHCAAVDRRPGRGRVDRLRRGDLRFAAGPHPSTARP